MTVSVWRLSHVPMPPPKPWPCVADSFYVSPLQTPHRISGGRLTCIVTARRSASGAPGIWSTGLQASRMRHAQGGRGAFPPAEQLDVLSLATRTPADHHSPATRWSLDDRTAVLRDHTRTRVMSRSTLWRTLDAADLTPHRRVSWLNSHDPAFEAKARDLCALYVKALRFYQEGRLVICVDEKTGMQMLQRTYPTQPAQPGTPEKREHESIRHGVRVFIASLVVPTGQVLWHLGPPRTRADFAVHLAHVVRQRPDMPRYDWVVDTLNTHWSLEVCRLVAAWCDLPFHPQALHRGAQRRAFLSDPTHKHVVHFTPKHGSWLHQVELWFSVLARRFLKRGDFCSVEDCEARLLDYLEGYNTQYAHPYRWTYTGQPLVRATPFSQTRRQQQHGRAWFSPRPKPFARAFYPPRPYNRSTTRLMMN
jgi:hypothetical protein